jgi:hypothetical protein
VGSTTEILERVGVNDFLNCTNVTANNATAPRSRLGRLFASVTGKAARFFLPAPLVAAHGGLGGKVRSFSPFGAVDPLTGLVIDPEVAIASSPGPDDVSSVDFDGTNYVVPVRSGQNPDTLTVRFVSATGASGAKLNIPNARGGAPRVAFDGTNHLLAWGTEGTNTNAIMGQFVSKSGSFVGSSFPIIAAGVAHASALAFGGGTYMLVYSRLIDANLGDFGNRLFVRSISPSGAVGNLVQLTNFLGAEGFNNIAFDGTNFFVVYNDATNVRGRFVSPAGVLGPEVTIATAGALTNISSVAFNGTNYLVSFSTAVQSADAYARLVSPAGTMVSAVIPVSTESGSDEFPTSTLASGTNFLVSYSYDFLSVGKTTFKARWVTGGGSVRGPPFTIAGPKDGRVPIGILGPINGSRYFAVMIRGVQSAAAPENTDEWTQTDIFGTFMTIPLPPGP